jgi:hypothetical protein
MLTLFFDHSKPLFIFVIVVCTSIYETSLLFKECLILIIDLRVVLALATAHVLAALIHDRCVLFIVALLAVVTLITPHVSHIHHPHAAVVVSVIFFS